jgi:hypothetical protein
VKLQHLRSLEMWYTPPKSRLAFGDKVIRVAQEGEDHRHWCLRVTQEMITCCGTTCVVSTHDET